MKDTYFIFNYLYGIFLITSILGCNGKCSHYSDYFLCQKHSEYLDHYSPLLDAITLEYYCTDTDSMLANLVYQECLDICYNIPDMLMKDDNVLDCTIHTYIEDRYCPFSIYKNRGVSADSYSIISEYHDLNPLDMNSRKREKSGFSDRVRYSDMILNKVFYIDRKLSFRDRNSITIRLFVKTPKSREVKKK